MSDPLRTLALFALLAACAGLWYGARAVRRGRHAPAWAVRLQDKRLIAVGLAVIAVLALAALGVTAVVSLLAATSSST